MIAKIIMTGCLAVLLTGGVYAEGNNINYLPIKPVPAVEKNKHRVAVEHNIRLIQLSGVVERITAEDIDINDTRYRFSPDVVFFSKDQKTLDKTDITDGCIVGLRLDDNGEIYKLWKLEEPQQ